MENLTPPLITANQIHNQQHEPNITNLSSSLPEQSPNNQIPTHVRKSVEIKIDDQKLSLTIKTDNNHSNVRNDNTLPVDDNKQQPIYHSLSIQSQQNNIEINTIIINNKPSINWCAKIRVSSIIAALVISALPSGMAFLYEEVAFHNHPVSLAHDLGITGFVLIGALFSAAFIYWTGNRTILKPLLSIAIPTLTSLIIELAYNDEDNTDPQSVARYKRIRNFFYLAVSLSSCISAILSTNCFTAERIRKAKEEETKQRIENHSQRIENHSQRIDESEKDRKNMKADMKDFKQSMSELKRTYSLPLPYVMNNSGFNQQPSTKNPKQNNQNGDVNPKKRLLSFEKGKFFNYNTDSKIDYTINKGVYNNNEQKEKKSMNLTGINPSNASSILPTDGPKKLKTSTSQQLESKNPVNKTQLSTNKLQSFLNRLVAIIIQLWTSKEYLSNDNSKLSNKSTPLGIELSRLGVTTSNLQNELKNANYKPDAAQWAIRQLNKAITDTMKQQRVDLWQALAILEKNKDRIIEQEKTKQIKEQEKTKQMQIKEQEKTKKKQKEIYNNLIKDARYTKKEAHEMVFGKKKK